MHYIISGKVIKGDGYGKKLGFPTVNLDAETKEFPLDGIYVGIAVLDDIKYRAGIVVGPNRKIEAHLIRYNGDAYRKKVILEIKEFLRKFKKFKTEKKLIAQIKKDIKKCSQA